MRYYLICAVLFFLVISCNSKEKEEEYYENGNLKTVSLYKQDEELDSLLHYYKDPKNQLKKIEYYQSKDTISVVEFSKNNIKIREGFTLNNGNKIGKWRLYNQNGYLSEVLEYINLSGKEYLNQGWHIDKNGDTIVGKGNHIKITLSKDTINLFEPLKILVHLKEPLLSYNSDTFICLPKGELGDIAKDFSNINKIEWDTLPSIRDEKIIKNYNEYNHYVSFGLEFNTYGDKSIRGFLVEQIKKDLVQDASKLDTLNVKERKIFFNEKIYVQDSE